MDQEDREDHNPPWWTRSGFYILLMILPSVTASWVVGGIDRVTILSLYQSAVYNETKYRRLRLICCNKTSYYIATTK